MGSEPQADLLEQIIEIERAIRDRESATYDQQRVDYPYASEVEDTTMLHELDLDRGVEVVLDAGCGTGHHLAHLLTKANQVIGVDHSAGFLEQARRRLTPDQAERVELTLADLRSLPLEDDSVDRVLCEGVIQHIPSTEHRLATLREQARVLKPGGRLVISAYRWRGAIKRRKEGYFDGGLYRYAFTAREFQALLIEAGYEDVSVGGVVILPRAAERLRVSVESQRRLAFTPVGRHLAHYVIGRGTGPAS